VSVRVVPFGDRAVLAIVPEGDVDPDGAAVHRLAAAIERWGSTRSGWGPVVPAAESVLVRVDPRDPGPEAASATLAAALAGDIAGRDDQPVAAPGGALPVLELPTRYGGEDGPDLDWVAARAGLSAAAVVDRHAARVYRVRFLGFAPGFGYLGAVDPAIAVPRLETPRVHVPAGSVAIAGDRTAVYPSTSPGGWRIIGRTDAALWDPWRDPPGQLVPGRRVRFVPLGPGS
jgi:allophanate hydrolase subunit 1